MSFHAYRESLSLITCPGTKKRHPSSGGACAPRAIHNSTTSSNNATCNHARGFKVYFGLKHNHFQQFKAKTKLQRIRRKISPGSQATMELVISSHRFRFPESKSEERKVMLVVASPEIANSIVVIAYKLRGRDRKIVREQGWQCSVWVVASEHTEMVREMTEKSLKKSREKERDDCVNE
ncbi:hypothetical protein DVH24_010792 [Malus domestica]|uniref:Uncharacterized protein n=1 Tax=Malus domestica TaxID=3750 RepID=A0A498JU55_MALDO|nr:hypothetical protein DVH24_010792 [Malus domestica]